MQLASIRLSSFNGGVLEIVKPFKSKFLIFKNYVLLRIVFAISVTNVAILYCSYVHISLYVTFISYNVHGRIYEFHSYVAK